MRRLAATFLLVFISWLLLTYSLQPESLLAGVLLSLAITFISRHLLSRETPEIFLHPLRWIGSVLYILVLVYSEILAHLDVMSRIFTGKIRPAIVKTDPGFGTPLGKTIFGNSVTLTPGTLTLKVFGDETHFFVHCLHHRSGQEVGHLFKRFGRRVMGYD